MSKAIDLENGLPAIKTWIEGKFVEQESGKGLSTNDYTTTEKNKLAGIADGAEVNVQPDWDATSGDAAILNKPTIPSKTSDLTNDSGFITSSDVPEAGTATPSMDGTAAVGSSTKYARENHVHPTDTSRAPMNHASTATSYGVGNASNYGHVKLSDATNGTEAAASGRTAATPKAVSDALAAAKSYTDTKVTGLYSYKGSVATYADLPASNANGDVYNVEAAYGDYPAGTNFAWDGTAWDALGGSFTITYATAAEVTAVLEA